MNSTSKRFIYQFLFIFSPKDLLRAEIILLLFQRKFQWRAKYASNFLKGLTLAFYQQSCFQLPWNVARLPQGLENTLANSRPECECVTLPNGRKRTLWRAWIPSYWGQVTLSLHMWGTVTTDRCQAVDPWGSNTNRENHVHLRLSTCRSAILK